MKIKFRFATSEDSKYFYDLLLTEKNKIHRQLAISGIENNEFEGNPFRASFAAEVDGQRVGFVKVIGGGSSGFNGIGLFYVIPQRRREGIGKEMLQFAEQYARNNWNASGVDLYTIDNEPMEKLVKKAGFIVSGVYKKSYAINGKFYGQSRWMKMYKK